MLQSQSHHMHTHQHSVGRATNSAQPCDDGIVAITAAALPRLLKERKISQSVGRAEVAFKRKEATPQTYFNTCANTTL